MRGTQPYSKIDTALGAGGFLLVKDLVVKPGGTGSGSLAGA